MSNQHDFSCPECGGQDDLEIQAKIWVTLTRDGTDATASAKGDHEWDDMSPANCFMCNWGGEAVDLEQPKRKYIGNPARGGTVTVETYGEHCVVQYERALPPRLDLYSHSPDGLSWGYHGSGPSQLALALLAWETGDDEWSLIHYKAYMDEEIVVLEQAEPFAILSRDVRRWVHTRRLEEKTKKEKADAAK